MADRFTAGYGKLVEACVDRWDRALNDVQQRRYSPQSLLSDMLGYWTDVAAYASKLATPPQMLPPVAATTIDSKQTRAVAAVSVGLQSVLPLIAADLQLVAAVDVRIPADKVQATLVDGGKVLVVQLNDLDKVAGGLKPGLYRATIKDAATKNVIASVELTVTA